MPENNRIDLIELPSSPDALPPTRLFYESVFGWAFTDYGAYLDTASGGTTFGVNAIPDENQQRMPMAVVYAHDLDAALQRVTDAGGTILHGIYSFPGGRRFQFSDPSGNELAVWSE